jgi:hypothetical protein
MNCLGLEDTMQRSVSLRLCLAILKHFRRLYANSGSFIPITRQRACITAKDSSYLVEHTSPSHCITESVQRYYIRHKYYPAGRMKATFCLVNQPVGYTGTE